MVEIFIRSGFQCYQFVKNILDCAYDEQLDESSPMIFPPLSIHQGLSETLTAVYCLARSNEPSIYQLCWRAALVKFGSIPDIRCSLWSHSGALAVSKQMCFVFSLVARHVQHSTEKVGDLSSVFTHT